MNAKSEDEEGDKSVRVGRVIVLLLYIFYIFVNVCFQFFF